MVDFYAPGNEHSQKYAPMFIEIANRLTASNWTNAVQIVALDCVVYNDACKMYKVDTYPDVRIKLLGNDDDPAKVASKLELGVGPLLSSMYLELKGSCTDQPPSTRWHSVITFTRRHFFANVSPHPSPTLALL